jgi:hypothetical protein
MPRRPLPPRVLDLHAPQYPLPDLARPSRSAHGGRSGALHHPSPRGGGGDNDRSPDLHGEKDPTTTTTPPSRLSAIVARYLAARLGTIGAPAMVAEFGAGAVLAALPAVMVRETHEIANSGPSWEQIKAWRAAGAKGQLGGRRYRTVWRPNPGLYRPGGFLRRQLQRDAAALTGGSRNGYHAEAAPATEPRRVAIGGQ